MKLSGLIQSINPVSSERVKVTLKVHGTMFTGGSGQASS